MISPGGDLRPVSARGSSLDLAREAKRKADRLEREWLLGHGGVLNKVWSRSVIVQTDLSYVETQRRRQENLVWRSAHLDCPRFS